jgi:hypothetical protein
MRISQLFAAVVGVSFVVACSAKAPPDDQLGGHEGLTAQIKAQLSSGVDGGAVAMAAAATQMVQPPTIPYTATVTNTATGTGTVTAVGSIITVTTTGSVTNTVTRTASATKTLSATGVVTATFTGTKTGTLTSSGSKTATSIATGTATWTGTYLGTGTATGTKTLTGTLTGTATLTGTLSITATGTKTNTGTKSATGTTVGTGSGTATLTYTAAPTATATSTATTTGTNTATVTKTATLVITSTATSTTTTTNLCSGTWAFCDNFETGNGSGWNVQQGPVQNFAVVGDGSMVYRENDPSASQVYISQAQVGMAWMDSTAEASLKPLSFSSSTATVSLWSRYDATYNADCGYYVSLRGDGKVALGKRVVGVNSAIGSPVAVPGGISTGTWYDVKLAIQGTNLTAYVNGTQLLTQTDSSCTSGSVGVGSVGASFEADDVRVTAPTTNACVQNWRDPNNQCGAFCTYEVGVQGDRVGCGAYLDCYATHGCSPETCGAPTQVCGVNQPGLNGWGNASKEVADQVYKCLGCAGSVNCANPKYYNGTVCADGNPCTWGDTCQNGLCTPDPNRNTTCTASDECHAVGTCDTTSGICSNPAKQQGTTCNDGNVCTNNDVCAAGVCGGTLYTCDDGLACTADTCNGDGTCTFTPNAGSCAIDGACYAANATNPVTPCQQCTPTVSQTAWSPATDGTTCSDGNACTNSDVCTAGVCGGTPYTCDDGLACTTDTCNGDGTCTFIVTLGNCAINGECYANTATSPQNSCLVCDSTQPGAWSNQQDGTTCNNGSPSTPNGTCKSGTCLGSNTNTNACTGMPDGTSCNDGNPCTNYDSCSGGICSGTPITSSNCDAGRILTAKMSPGPHEVTVCSDANYKGTCKTFSADATEAHHKVRALNPFGLNDNISSIIVGSSVRLHAFADVDYSATCGGESWQQCVARIPSDIKKYGYLPDESLIANRQADLATCAAEKGEPIDSTDVIQCALSLCDARNHPASNSYSCFLNYDIGDNPMDVVSVATQNGTKYAQRATYEPNSQLRNHQDLGANVGDHTSSLIIDNLDVIGYAEPLASKYVTSYPSSDGGVFWADGAEGLCHNKDYWFITESDQYIGGMTGLSACVTNSDGRVPRLGRIFRCPIDCDLNASNSPLWTSANSFYIPPTGNNIPGMFKNGTPWGFGKQTTPELAGSCAQCVTKSLYDYSNEWKAADGADYYASALEPNSNCLQTGDGCGGYHHFGDPDCATVNGTDYVLVPMQSCENPRNPAYILVLDKNLDYVARWQIPTTPQSAGAAYVPFGTSAAWVAVRPGTNDIWTSYSDYLLNQSYRDNDPFYANDDANLSGNGVQNGLLHYSSSIWINPAGGSNTTNPRITPLSPIGAPIIYGLRGYPVSVKTAQGGVFSPSGSTLYLSVGYTGNEGIGGTIDAWVCDFLGWFGDNCNQPNDSGTLMALDVAPDANTLHVLAVAGNNYGNFNYQFGSNLNTNEPQGIDFFDTSCYVAEHGGQVPPSLLGFSGSQLHAVETNDNLISWDSVYLKHYKGLGLGSMCDGGSVNVKAQMAMQPTQVTSGVFCSGQQVQGSLLACEGFEGDDHQGWKATTGGEAGWKIGTDRNKGTDFAVLVEKDVSNAWRDYITCGSSDGSGNAFPTSQSVASSVQLGVPGSSSTDSQGAVVYALYSDANNAYYAALDASGNISLRKRVNGADYTLAAASTAAPQHTWNTLSLQVFPTTDTVHPPAGRLWAVVSFGVPSSVLVPVLDVLADSEPAWTSGCSGIGTFGTSAAFDDFVVSTPPGSIIY